MEAPPPHVKATVCLLQEFDDPRDAEDAVYELDGKELCNERWARRPRGDGVRASRVS